MTSILSVAEKPSVAKELARVIAGDGACPSRQGHSPYNRIFDIASCQFRNMPAKMSITSVSGHMMNIDFTDAHRTWGSCDPLVLFTAPIEEKVAESSENIAKTLREEARKHNTLLLWLDCDLEGEAISFEVIKVCLQGNPRMEVYRARFSALTPRDITRTMTNPERPNEHMNDAVNARKEIDLRIGAAFTRFQTRHIQRRFEALSDIIISYGPCQFPTLGFIIERHLKIEKFRAESFWYLTCELRGPDPDNAPNGTMSCSFSWDRVRLYDRFACAVFFESIVSAGAGAGAGGGDGDDDDDGNSNNNNNFATARARVYRNDARQTQHRKPNPLNTVELQQRAARFLNIGSETTMKVAEELYNRGILSYPRTETDSFQEGVDLRALIEEQRAHSVWGTYAASLLDNNKMGAPSNGGHDDQAHPPIHPLKCVEARDLKGEDEVKIYELVTRHFLASCSLDAQGNQTDIGIIVSNSATATATADAGACAYPDGVIGEGERFSAKGLMVMERNFLDVYKYDKWSGRKVPLLRVGDVVQPSSLSMHEGHTTPPAPLKEEDLINTMDKNGIGTDATIATHIKTIQDRNYATKSADRSFQPTQLGLALYDAYNDMGYQLTKPYLRATMEADCQKIAKGQLNKTAMVKACIDHMRECFVNCVKNADKLDAAMVKHNFANMGAGGGANGGAAAAAEYTTIETRHLSLCGKCRKKMDLKSKLAANGNTKRILYCTHCSEQWNVPQNIHNATLEAVDHTCPICKFQVLRVTFPNKMPWNFCPHCFTNPPGAPDAEEGSTEDFKCFQCAHPGCTLATRIIGREVNVAPCLEKQCSGFFRIKATSKGGFMASCSNSKPQGDGGGGGCPSKPWFLPKMIRGVSASASETCEKCTRKQQGGVVHKISIHLHRESAPLGSPLQLTICPCCDAFWGACSERPLPLKIIPVIVADDRSEVRNENRTASAANQLHYPPQQAQQYPPQQQYPPPQQQQYPPPQQQQYPPPQQYLPKATSDYGAATTGKNYQNPQAFVGGASGPSMNVMCPCNIPAAQRTVHKDGPNKGRLFFCCSKPQGEQCKFFEWSGGAGGGGGGFGGGGGGGGGAQIICSRCQGAGHYAKSCPVPR